MNDEELQQMKDGYEAALAANQPVLEALKNQIAEMALKVAHAKETESYSKGQIEDCRRNENKMKEWCDDRRKKIESITGKDFISLDEAFDFILNALAEIKEVK